MQHHASTLASRKFVLSLAVFVLATAPLALAQGAYTQIDYPGAAATFAQGIDTAGDVVGSYLDANSNWHGFLLSGGVYATIDYPGGVGTLLYGINDLDQIVGDEHGNNPDIAFVYDVQTQTFTTISYPDSTATYVLCINDAGVAGGYFIYAHTQYGFELVGSKYKRIAPPGAFSTFVNGIAGTGEVVGYDFDFAGRQENFLLNHGKYDALNLSYAPSATLLGISRTGNAIVGMYAPSSGVTAGFLYQDGTLQELLPTGSSYSIANSMNQAGVVVGLFADTNGYHGFTWTPPAGAAKK